MIASSMRLGKCGRKVKGRFPCRPPVIPFQYLSLNRKERGGGRRGVGDLFFRRSTMVCSREPGGKKGKKGPRPADPIPFPVSTSSRKRKKSHGRDLFKKRRERKIKGEGTGFTKVPSAPSAPTRKKRGEKKNNKWSGSTTTTCLRPLLSTKAEGGEVTAPPATVLSSFLPILKRVKVGTSKERERKGDRSDLVPCPPPVTVGEKGEGEGRVELSSSSLNPFRESTLERGKGEGGKRESEGVARVLVDVSECSRSLSRKRGKKGGKRKLGPTLSNHRQRKTSPGPRLLSPV